MATITYLTTRRTKVTSKHTDDKPPQPPKSVPYHFEILWTTPDGKYAVVDGFMPIDDARKFVR